MEKILVVIVVFVVIFSIIRYKPPFVVNSVESLVVFIRAIGLQFTFPKYFHNDPVSYKAILFEEVLNNSKPTLQKDKDQWTLNSSFGGEERPTTIILLNGYQVSKPSLIYHHGAGSTKPVRDYNVIFGDDFKTKFNVFVVWAQFHTSKKDYLEKSVDSFLHHQQTFAGSVLAYEEIIKFHHAHSELPIVATGSSMGGIVSSLHAFYFGSADFYFPIVAYPNVGEIFTGNAYKTAVDNWSTKSRNTSYIDSFEIKKFDKNLNNKVFPIIGENDHIVTSHKAIDFWESRGFKITKYPYGHFTPGIMRNEIRKSIQGKVGV